MSKLQNFTIYGGGSWGTALACVFAQRLQKVNLYVRDPAIVDEILHYRTNSKYLGSIKLPNNIYPSSQKNILNNQDVIVIAAPSTAFMETIHKLKELITPTTILLIATKGLAEHPVQLFSESVKNILPNPIAFISGPNLAKEAAQNFLTSATIACSDLRMASDIVDAIASKSFIVHPTDDIVTVQIAGVIKNIIAIKSGIYDAIGHKRNAKAWLMTQALQEIITLSVALGGKIESVTQPAVIGDLVLTCYSKDSRNTKFGYKLYHQPHIKEFLRTYPHLVEGLNATRLVSQLAARYAINLPTINSVVKVLGDIENATNTSR